MPNFNPRAPYGARPVFRDIALQRVRISIHAPHTGRDDTLGTYDDAGSDFNPRAPYGARLSRRNKQRISSRFQSTRPIRGATHAASYLCQRTGNFNPRAPYGARLCPGCRKHNTRYNFNPRAPYGARPTIRTTALVRFNFNPRAPYGARLFNERKVFKAIVFQSTRPIRGATRGFAIWSQVLKISIHAPHTGRDSKNA